MKWLLEIVFIVGQYVLSITSAETAHISMKPGHLQPFGFGRPTQNLEEVDSFPPPQTFFENYVYLKKPLLIRGGAKVSKAFKLWTDDYLLSTNEPEDNIMVAERQKKEIIAQKREELTLKEFVRIYNDSELYMTTVLPAFLSPDVTLPWPLQCGSIQIPNLIQEAVLWFSSGGTKSTTHPDDMENLHCSFRGQKRFLLIDPKFYHNIDLAGLNGEALGVMDVDRVDFTKYPWLAEAEYLKAVLAPGDCIYVPYKWVHQVQSFNSNLAINIWWDHYRSFDIQFDKCSDVLDPEMTMDKVPRTGYNISKMSNGVLRDFYLGIAQFQAIDLELFEYTYRNDLEQIDDPELFNILDPEQSWRDPIIEMFDIIDKDNDGLLDSDNINNMTDEDWNMIKACMRRTEARIDIIEEKWHKIQSVKKLRKKNQGQVNIEEIGKKSRKTKNQEL